MSGERNWEVFSFHLLDNPCFFLVPFKPVAENARPTQCVSGRVGFVAVTLWRENGPSKKSRPICLLIFGTKMPWRFLASNVFRTFWLKQKRAEIGPPRLWLPIIYRCWSNISWGKLLLQVSGVKWWFGRSSFSSRMDFECIGKGKHNKNTP